MALEGRIQFFKQVSSCNFMIKKTRTKNIVSELSLNFLKVFHRARNRGSLFFPLRIWRGEVHAKNHDF